MTSTLAILGTTIRQDAEGRFCLNDCHKAAGAASNDAPAQWLRTDTAKKLIAELETMQNCTVSETTGKPVLTEPGRNGGTYAVKELVYAYAMWISASFHLTVIRAFDALVMGNAPAINLNDPAFLRQTLLGYTDKVIALQAENAALAPKAEVADKIANSDGLYTLNLSAKAAQMPVQQFIRAAHANGFIFKQNGKWNAYSEKVKAGFCHVKFYPYRDRDGDERFSPQVFFTPKGIERIVKISSQH
ncbi:MAG: phage antirepressor KilAC domain-containing protein [Acetobacter papayae]|uniref:phage antirepressor KilAC domain-containing protein n=1 Tax=Acetobacter papayae TaxID=1076592 RepID=UPI0039EB6341